MGREVELEVGAELRTRITENIGLVPFVEGGAVTTDVVPTFDTPLQWAAGIGLRYFTVIGPLRFDVAVPINARPTDDDFEFYISIGQAF